MTNIMESDIPISTLLNNHLTDHLISLIDGITFLLA